MKNDAIIKFITVQTTEDNESDRLEIDAQGTYEKTENGYIIEYSENIAEDLSKLKVKEFLVEIEKVAKESYRVLKKGKFCAILMGDTRQKGHVIPMSFEVMKIFEGAGFKTKEIIVKEQHNCKATGFWKTNSVKYNFLLIAHEYLFVFRK